MNRGEVIARLDNADFQAAVAQAQANVATADASVIEATADRDQSARDAAAHPRDPHAQPEPDVAAGPRDVDEPRDGRPRALQRRASRGSGAPRRRCGSPRRATRTPSSARPFTGTVLRKDAEVGEVVAPSVGAG